MFDAGTSLLGHFSVRRLKHWRNINRVDVNISQDLVRHKDSCMHTIKHGDFRAFGERGVSIGHEYKLRC